MYIHYNDKKAKTKYIKFEEIYSKDASLVQTVSAAQEILVFSYAPNHPGHNTIILLSIPKQRK